MKPASAPLIVPDYWACERCTHSWRADSSSALFCDHESVKRHADAAKLETAIPVAWARAPAHGCGPDADKWEKRVALPGFNDPRKRIR